MSEIDEKASARKIIDDILKEYDNVELLSRLCFYTYFVPKGKDPNWRLRELPFVEFLGGLSLCHSYCQNKQPSEDIMNDLINAIQSYFDNDVRIWMGKPSDDDKFGTEHLIHVTRLQKILSQVNAGGYESQISALTRDIFGKMDDYFLNTFGFTIADALDYQQKLKARLETRFNMRTERANERISKLKKDLSDPIISSEIRKECIEKGMTEDKFIRFIGYSIVFENSKELSVLNIETFCKEEDVQNRDRLEKYLNIFSCKFGAQYKAVNSVLDDMISFTKPFIALDKGNYLTPFLFIFRNRRESSA